MRRLFYAACVFASVIAAPLVLSGQGIEIPSDPGPMARQVRQEFLYSWNAYKQYAWGHDELKPLSGASHDWYQ
ncbi:MAG TPA: glycoside hydrolase family 47 protein, partial [Candidatus Angelobacter sp.]|nr:glycoside hydrolase family 47 protein [Candidatus Angelobacter sp.]